jgi:hypothetical protein
MCQDLVALQTLFTTMAASVLPSIITITASVTQLTHQLDDIVSKLLNTPPALDGAAPTSSSACHPSYADVLSAGVVKAAVSEAIREHHQIVSDEPTR